MVSIRDESGALVGSSGDVIKELTEAREAGEEISVEEAEKRAMQNIADRRSLERVAEKLFGGPDPKVKVIRESTKDSGPV